MAYPSEFAGSVVLIQDFSTTNKLLLGSPIICYVKRISESFKLNIKVSPQPFQSTDFIDEDNLDYRNIANRHKGNIQFNGFENDTWTIAGDFTTQLGSTIQYNAAGSVAFYMSPYILKMLKEFPRQLYIRGEHAFGPMINSFNIDLPNVNNQNFWNTQAGIPVVIESGTWNNDVSRDGGGNYSITFKEDKEAL